MLNELVGGERTEAALLDFIVESSAALRVLVIEGNVCLANLRNKLPQAEMFAVSNDENAAEDYPAADVKYITLDYCETPLNFKEKYFDYIIAPRALELCGNPQDIAAGLGTFLKDTGFLLTSFLNIRHWKIIEELKVGHFYYFGRHMFTKEEMERLLCASFYKDTVFAPILKKAPEGVLEDLIAGDFENNRNDLETEIWLVKAGRSTPELAVLKSLYTPGIRKKLSRLLHRIEYDVECEQSIETLWEFCQKENIFPSYLAEFIAMTVIHREKVTSIVMELYCQHKMPVEADEFCMAARNIKGD